MIQNTNALLERLTVLVPKLLAKFTALAMLLPVVPGQSGNAGAQALAVTMRGLALHAACFPLPT